MTILSAQTIRQMRPVEPFHERTVTHGMTFGLGPAGYDIRVREMVTVWPHSAVLASSVERFTIPDDVMAFVTDKSTWARRGVALQNTVAEPGWCGYLTLEISNHSNSPVTILAGSPIAQIVFMRLDEPTEIPYRGKYQDQEPLAVGARFEGAS